MIGTLNRSNKHLKLAAAMTPIFVLLTFILKVLRPKKRAIWFSTSKINTWQKRPILKGKAKRGDVKRCTGAKRLIKLTCGFNWWRTILIRYNYLFWLNLSVGPVNWMNKYVEGRVTFSRLVATYWSEVLFLAQVYNYWNSLPSNYWSSVTKVSKNLFILYNI